MFAENKFKVEIIGALPPDARITLYRVGPMVDLCRGPHVPHTGLLKAVAVTSASRAFWRADVKNDPLQRVYAITFPDAKLLREYKHRIEEARKRDHRVVGPQQELFFFHPLSPGSCFFLPHGARVYNALVDYIKEKYWEYEYQARGCRFGEDERLASRSLSLTPPSVRSAGSDHAQHLQLRPVEDVRPRGALQRRDVRVPRGEGGVWHEADGAPMAAPTLPSSAPPSCRERAADAAPPPPAPPPRTAPGTA